MMSGTDPSNDAPTMDASHHAGDVDPLHDGAFSRRELSKGKRSLVFAVVAILWLVLDIVTKGIANSHTVGQVFAVPLPGIIDLKLVHNTGGAWGMFGDMTLLLGIISALICVAIIVFVFFCKDLTSLSVISLALVFAGGLGNAIDRFEYGYVIDFISTAFIDFPVFNVADIGVTCGIVLFLISLIGFKGSYGEKDVDIETCDRDSRSRGKDMTGGGE